jgi:hypothetical protein
MDKKFEMNTVQDMEKILIILDKDLMGKKGPYDSLPERSSAEYRALGENPYEFLALIKQEKKVVDDYFNCLQMWEWASDHKRWIETGLDGFTVRELSPVGKEILNKYLNDVISETWWKENEDRLDAEFESSREYMGDDDRNFEWYIEKEYQTYLQTL